MIPTVRILYENRVLLTPYRVQSSGTSIGFSPE